MASHGQNVWYELMTTDVEGAMRFYSETIGWKTQGWEEGDPDNPYLMWVAGERHVGGVMKLPEEAAQMGAPPHWLAYTRVDDVDTASSKTTELGGSVLKPAFDIDKVGRIAILADPQGGAFAVIKPVDDMPVSGEVGPGEFCWADLNTTDYEGAWRFYSELFGWKHTSTMEDSPAGPYKMFTDPGEATRGGMSNMAQQMNAPAHWLHYVTVDGLDAVIERVKQHGGEVLNGPMGVPGGDRIAQCKDPQGVVFAVHEKGKQ